MMFYVCPRKMTFTELKTLLNQQVASRIFLYLLCNQRHFLRKIHDTQYETQAPCMFVIASEIIAPRAL